MNQQYENILGQIGNTPLVPIKNLFRKKGVEILAKLECFNPGGSVKDRPALYMIEEAEHKGELTREKTILEATSGNTGIGLALVAAVKGYRILLTMSESVSEERVKILRALGAEIVFTPARLSTDGAIEHVYRLVREEPERYWLADQFNNEANWKAHYYGTATEIMEQTGGDLDVIVATMGTTGTLMGLARRFQETKPEVKIIGVEPYLGHKIQGLKNMKESYQPGIFEKKRLAHIVNIEDEEAFQTARLLAKKEGIFVGMSSGAAMAAAIRIAGEMEAGRLVVILPDGGERYLSTPLYTARKKCGLRLYNTLTRKKDDFLPIRETQVSMYTCGPTLCQEIHIGQCRRFVFADLVKRYLLLKGFQVKHIMNVTDLDDTTIQGSENAGVSLAEFTKNYYDSFIHDISKLNILEATEYPKASLHVQEMIDLTQRLLEKGYAYEKFRSIYFDISRFSEYGHLSKIDLEKIRIGKTVDLDQYEKENPRDFTLLKRSTLSELKKGIFYQTQWGNIRPGWHLQCSAMALRYLGAPYDIHTSGTDLIFPHHENTIAIIKALTEKTPANYWLHNELVRMDSRETTSAEKNGKLTLKDLFRKGYSGREIRYWLLSRHYRKPLYFSWAKLETARNTLHHLDHFVQKVHRCPKGSPDPEMDQRTYDLRRGFNDAMDDDLNIASALASLFQFTREINRIMDQKGMADKDREKILDALKQIDSTLGVLRLEPEEPDASVEAIVLEREEARKNKDWERADDLRRRLLEMGVEVLDTRDGPVWRKISNP
ncbi:MAG: cysteine--tRNA ligase [Deltaproteobacteria bacterium]|nr:cysteine--tRNA ligase [Deltaproteobacteria bacterium]